MTPNVVIYISHDTGQYISPYGINTVNTPNAERLAQAGVLFENSFTTAPQCSPSRAALFTGRYPHCTGVLGLTGKTSGWDLADDEVHAAQYFRGLGYETALIGIAHETATHEKRGYDSIESGWGAKDVTDKFDTWLQNRQAEAPFYMQLGTFETHIPFHYVDDDDTEVTVAPWMIDCDGTRHDLQALHHTVEDWDRGLGRVIDLLEQHGLTDDTILVVTTDHGIAFPGAKCTPFDPGIEVLLMLHWPGGGISGGKRYPEIISNIDVLPTLLEACGMDELPERIQGRSFLPLLRGEAYEANDFIRFEKTYHEAYEPFRGVRSERFKYFRYFDQGPTIDIPSDMRLNQMYTDCSRQCTNSPSKRPFEALYDLDADPWEENNLADDPAFQAERDRHFEAMAQWLQETADPLLEGPVPSPWYRRAVADMRA